MQSRLTISLVGVGTVTAYAALMAVQALVLDPLAAVPGQTLPEIHAHLRADGMDVSSDDVSVLVAAAIGVALAVATGAIGVMRRTKRVVLASTFLAIIALGAFVTFGNGFALGMDVAESYGVGGEDHTVWAPVLYLTSLVALISLVTLLALSLHSQRKVAESTRGRRTARALGDGTMKR